MATVNIVYKYNKWQHRFYMRTCVPICTYQKLNETHKHSVSNRIVDAVSN